MRGALDPVPGCNNGEQDMSRTDYCIPEDLVPPTKAVPSVTAVSSRNAGGDLFLR
jgi:hypothetical protein